MQPAVVRLNSESGPRELRIRLIRRSWLMTDRDGVNSAWCVFYLYPSYYTAPYTETPSIAVSTHARLAFPEKLMDQAGKRWAGSVWRARTTRRSTSNLSEADEINFNEKITQFFRHSVWYSERVAVE